MVMQMEDRWLSVDEIGDYLGVKRDTVCKWIGEKEMPAHKISRLWKFNNQDVDEWVKSGGVCYDVPAKNLTPGFTHDFAVCDRLF